MPAQCAIAHHFVQFIYFWFEIRKKPRQGLFTSFVLLFFIIFFMNNSNSHKGLTEIIRKKSEFGQIKIRKEK